MNKQTLATGITVVVIVLAGVGAYAYTAKQTAERNTAKMQEDAKMKSEAALKEETTMKVTPSPTPDAMKKEATPTPEAMKAGQ